jgi:hypothetical protein
VLKGEGREMKRGMLVGILMTIVCLVNFTSLSPGITIGSVSNLIHNDVNDTFLASTYDDEVPAGRLMKGFERTCVFWHNWADGTGEPILKPNVTLVSPYSPESFWKIDPAPNSTSKLDSKYAYTWTKDKLLEDSAGQGISPDSIMQVYWQENESSLGAFNFASKREVNPSIVNSRTVVLNLTITVMPVETVARLCVEVHLENTTSFEVTAIQSQIVPQPNPVGGLNFTSSDKVYWEILNPNVYNDYEFKVPISMLNKKYPVSVSYKPYLHIYTHYDIEHDEKVEGNHVSITHPKWGNVTFSAEGTYTWYASWVSHLSALDYLSALTPPPQPPPPPVGGKAIPINKVTIKPINKSELLDRYIGLTILLAVAVSALAYVKKRKRGTEINS